MRIIGGSAGGAILRAPKGFDVRPTPDLVRQAVFNSLGPRVAGATVLELFAGTGALSLECLSRGAAQRRLRGKIQPPRRNSSGENLAARPACPALRWKSGCRTPSPPSAQLAAGRSTIRFDPGRSALRRKKYRAPLHLLRPATAGRPGSAEIARGAAGFSFWATPSATRWSCRPHGRKAKCSNTATP